MLSRFEAFVKDSQESIVNSGQSVSKSLIGGLYHLAYILFGFQVSDGIDDFAIRVNWVVGCLEVLIGYASEVLMFESFACGGGRYKLALKSSPSPFDIETIVLTLSRKFVVLGF